jgi:hypothetical protein
MKIKLLFITLLFSVLSWGQAIISWDFASGNTPNVNLPAGVTALSFNTAGTNGTSGCTTTGFSTNNWNVNEYLQIVIPTTGYEITTMTFNIRSSGTGPLNFKVQYSSTGTGGTFTDLGTTLTSNDVACVSRSADFTSINALDNNANTVIRLVFTGGEADGSPATGDAQSGGTFRIDDLIINGSLSCTPPSNPSGTISGTTPACTNTILSYSAPNANLYWQTTATGTSMANPTTSTYNAASTGTYYVRTYDGTSCWSTTAVSYAVTINTAPAISAHPINRSIAAAANTTFAVTATGTGLTYQWQVDTGGGFANLSNGGVYTNVTAATMNITGATLGMTGYLYRCVVSGTAPCTSVTSSSGSLTVNNVAPNNALSVTTCYGNSNISLSWTAATGSPDGYVVFALQSATAPAAATPNDAGTYNANSDFSLGSIVAPASLGKCVYKGAATTASITGLTNGVNYSFTVVAYKGATQTGWATGKNAGGTWNITNTTVDMPEVTALAATVDNAQSVLSWTNPTPSTCYDEYLVVANQGAVVFTPSGNGTAYTANAVYSGANQVVYKGTGTGVTVTGLTNGVSYCYKVFVRRGTEWSDGSAVCQTPNLIYCASSGNMTYDTSVTNVTINTINNTDLTKTAGYMDYTAQSTNLQRNEDYPLSVKLNTDGNYSVLAFAWIDFNRDGDFADAGEAFDLGSATNTTNGITTLSPLTITIPLTATLGATRMRIVATYDGDSSPCLTGFDGEVEDYTINITAACVPTHSVTGYAPTSGPTATDVTITGTGFTAGSTVTFNGVTATVVFVNSTTLIATVPSGLTTGNLVVKEAGCKLTAGSFTQINQTGVCTTSNNLTDLIISEVYDSLAANSWYMELYNPTNAPIDLDAAGADYKLIRYGTIGTTIGIRTVDISGVIAPGGIYLADLGSESICGALGFDFVEKWNGINENDEIRLTKNGVTVDIVHSPNEKGYSILRKVTAVGPTATFNGADWTTNSAESCANLDIVPFTFTNTTPTVNTNPADVIACGNTANFTITATAGSGGLTYQWFYNNGVTAGWTSLSTLAGLTITGETSNNLTLTGTVGSYDGYQFYCQVTESGTCSVASDAAQLDIISTTWNGTAWSNGVPTLGVLTIIDGNYNTTTNGDIDACSLIVNEGFTATVAAGDYINIQNDLTVDGTLDVQNNGSLVQISDTGVNIGDVFVKRTANIRLYDYVYWSSPVAGFPVTSISPSTPSSLIWNWNTVVVNPNGGFGNWQNGSGNMLASKGYIVRGPNGFNNTAVQGFTANFTGVPNNGVYAAAIQRGGFVGADYAGTNGVVITNQDDNWNLIGNPYPSSINSLAFITANTNIEGAVRLWSHSTLPSASVLNPFYDSFAYNYTATDYIVYNGTATTNGPAGFNGQIAAGQSFFVLMNDGAAASSTVVFNNALRNKSYDNTQFYRNADVQKNDANIERHRIWLDLISSEGSVNRTVVGYVEGATQQKDRIFDAYTNYKNAQNFYSVLNDDILVIQGRALPFTADDRVPMGITVPSNGTYNIAIAAVDGLFQDHGQIIYLEDRQLNIIHDLSSSPYQFIANKGIENERFVLRYNNGALGTGSFDVFDNNVVVATGNQEIQIKSQMELVKNIAVYDVLGRLIFEKKDVNAKEFSIQNVILNQQALIVKVTLTNGQISTRKIIY